MKQIVLSIEQMKHIQSIGVDISKGSIANVYAIVRPRGDVEPGDGHIELVAGEKSSDIRFTLQDIIELLPKYIYPFTAEKIVFSWTMECDTIAYRNIDCVDDCLIHFTGENVLDVAYQMLCWCAEKGYLTTSRK